MSKVEWLINELTTCIQRREIVERGYLLPVRALSGRFRSGQDTVIRALREIAARGSIGKCPCTGRWYPIYGRDSEPPRPEAWGALKPYERAAQSVCEAIASGRYSSTNKLPSAKELCSELGVSAPTLRKTLSLLQERRLVRRAGRSIIPGAAPAPAARSRVYLVGSRARVLRLLTTVNHSLLDGIERHLRRLGWTHLGLYMSDEPSAQTAPRPEQVAAYLFYGVPFGPWERYLTKQTQCPVVIMDPSETSRWFPSRSTLHKLGLRDSEHVCRLLSDNRAGGNEVGSLLVNIGHGSAAFINTVTVSDNPTPFSWIESRYLGLRDMLRSVQRLNGPVLDISSAPHYSSVWKLCGRITSGQDHLWGALGLGVADQLTEMIRVAELARIAEPVFTELLRDRKCRAWVFTNDVGAVAAYHFLANRGVKVPDDIALVGFDNSSLSLMRGITSYDFRLYEMGETAVKALAFPGAVKRDKDGNVMMRGELVVRGSTG